MPKSVVFKETAEVLAAAFPFLLSGLIEVSDAIPTPAGPVIKAVLQTTIFIMNKTEEYKTSNEDIYLLSARSAQIVTAIVNEHQRSKGSSQPDDGKLEGLKTVLDEISQWIQGKEPTNRRSKVLRYLKSDDTIKDVRRLDMKLDNAISRFGLQSQISAQKSLSDIQESIEKTKHSVADLVAEIKHEFESLKIRQYLEKNLSPSSKIESLSPTDSRCLGGTREDIMRDIEEWLESSQSTSSVTLPSIYWFTGVAGCGKSTLSRSAVDMAKEKNLISSCFYFSHDSDDRRRSDKLMTTVAVDLLASGDEILVQTIYRAMKDDNVSGTSPFSKQVDAFLKRPLSASGRPVVLIWDALDECTEPNSCRALIELLGVLPELPSSTRIFLTSRRGGDLERARERLGANVRHRDLTFDPHDEHDLTTHDIEAYIRHHSNRMRREGKYWLRDNDIPKLVALADGLFMAAEFICSLIDHSEWGQDRLESLLEEARYDQGGSATDKLYDWYHTGLQHIFDKDGTREVRLAKDVMAMILVVQYPLPRVVLASLLGLEEKVIDRILNRLSPFLGLAVGKTGVCFVHKSMSDFFVSDKAGRFHLDIVSASACVAVPCLEVLHSQVSEAFRSSVLPSSLSKAVDQDGLIHVPQVSALLAYASQFWGYHLKDVTQWKDVDGLVHELYFSHLLEWLHLMGHLNALDDAMASLHFIQGWKLASDQLDLLELAMDSIHFIQRFHYPLQTYTTVDFSWLHLTPTSTLLYQTYFNKSRVPSHILGGIPSSWTSLLISLVGHTQAVKSVAFSPDGKHILSGSTDRTLCIWDTFTGQLLGSPLRGHTQAVYSAVFSPDGKHIASGSNDQTVCIWDAFTGQCLGSPLRGHTNFVNTVAFSPDGKYVVSGSEDHTLQIWNAFTGQPVGSPLVGHTQYVNSVTFSPDGKHIISGSTDRTIQIWDAVSGHPVQPQLKGHKKTVISVAYSPDGKHIVSASGDLTVCIWDASTGHKLHIMKGHTGWVRSVAYSPDGKYIVSGSDDKTVRIWDALTGKPLGAPMKGHTGWVFSVAFSPDGKYIASGSDDKTIHIWDALPAQPKGSQLKGHTQDVTSIVFSPDGKSFVSGSNDHTVCLWDAITGNPLYPPQEVHVGRVTSVAFSPNGKHFISGSDDNTVQIWDALTCQPLQAPLNGHTHHVTCVCFSLDGEHIVSGSRDGTLQIWNALTGELLQSLKGHSMEVAAVTFSPDGKHIVSGSVDYTVYLWDVFTGQILHSLSRPNWGLTSIAFDLEGKCIVYGLHGQRVYIWDAFAGQLLDSSRAVCAQKHTHTLEVDDFILLSDGWLVTHDHRQICWLPNHVPATSIAWSKATRRLVVGYRTGLVIIVKI